MRMSDREKKEKVCQFVKTYVRQRPATVKEIDLRRVSVVSSIISQELVVRHEEVERKYCFDRVFGPEAPQSEVYDVVGSPLINLVINGYNCTIFAYGQTGTGKTHTMLGDGIDGNVNHSDDYTAGIIPRASSHLFAELKKLSPDVRCGVSITFVEIYNEEIRDLLSAESCPLKIFEDPVKQGSIMIKDLTSVSVCNPEEVYRWLKVGVMERQTATTNSNRHSSRSHALFTFLVSIRETRPSGVEIIKRGKLHLIDLAGSENVGKSGATNMRAREAGTINKSLLTLGKVIKALAQKASHVPYRDSKLTRILQDSLGGNTTTHLIATFSPCFDAWDETLSTLDYANMARKVANCPKVNVNKNQSWIILQYNEEISKLKAMLASARDGEGFFVNKDAYEKMLSDIGSNEKLISTLLKEIQSSEEQKDAVESQFFDLEECFSASNRSLASKKDTLKEKEKTARHVQRVLQYLEERDKELLQISDALFNVCETSIKHGDIYRAKHENLCNFTASNANAARARSANATRNLRSIAITSGNFLRVQNANLKDAAEEVVLLKEIGTKSQGEIESLALMFENKLNERRLTRENLFKGNEDYSERVVDDFMKQVFQRIRGGHARRQFELNRGVCNLREHVLQNSEKIKAISDDLVHAKNAEYEKNEIFHQLMTESVDNVAKKMEVRCERIEKCKDEAKNMEQLFLRFKVKYDQKERERLEKASSLEDMIQQANVLIEKFNKTNTISQLNDELVGCKNKQNEALESITTDVDDALYAMRNSEETVKQVFIEKKDEVQSYFSKMHQLFNRKIACYNEGQRKFFGEVENHLDSLKNRLQQNGIENSSHVENRIEHMCAVLSECQDDFKNLVQRSSDEVKKFDRSVMVSTRVGDTPKKRTYCVSGIKERMSDEDLLKRCSSESE